MDRPFPSNSPVQFAAAASAASDGSGDVTVTLYPPLLPGAVQAASSDTANIDAGYCGRYARNSIAIP